MYEEFYGFSQRPFAKTPNPAFLYRSPMHEEALARLTHGAEERELVLLTGEIGTGKTLLSRALIDGLDGAFRPILMVNPRLAPGQFLRALAMRLDVERPSFFRADLIEQIHGALYRLHEQDVCPVLVIDEAQLLPSKATFEEIRLLTNFALDDLNLLSLALIGQPELRRRLRHPSLRAFRQRVGISYHLGPMGREDTGRYLAHRLGTAGGDPGLFSEDAVDIIYRYSGGLPRVINNIASNALLTGYSREASSLGADIVQDAVEDLDLDPQQGDRQWTSSR